MNSSTPQPTDAKPVDADLVEQAVPGHGIPSQDPDLSAQVALSPEEAERESKSTLIGGGLVAGTATGAAVGAAVAGPVGILVGGMVGAVAGAMGGAGVGAMSGADAGEVAESEESTTRAENAIKDAENTDHNILPR